MYVLSCPWIRLRLTSCRGEFLGIEAGEIGLFRRSHCERCAGCCRDQWQESEASAHVAAPAKASWTAVAKAVSAAASEPDMNLHSLRATSTAASTPRTLDSHQSTSHPTSRQPAEECDACIEQYSATHFHKQRLVIVQARAFTSLLNESLSVAASILPAQPVDLACTSTAAPNPGIVCLWWIPRPRITSSDSWGVSTLPHHSQDASRREPYAPFAYEQPFRAPQPATQHPTILALSVAIHPNTECL